MNFVSSMILVNKICMIGGDNMGIPIKIIIEKLSKFNQNATVKDFDDPDYEISDIYYNEEEDEIYVKFD